jgi:hypothetical protein
MKRTARQTPSRKASRVSARSTKALPSKGSRKLKYADARDVRHYPDGRSTSQPLVETALACIRNWVHAEGLAVSTAEDYEARERATANLRRTAELAVSAEIGLFVSRERGRTGGKKSTSSKAAEILAEAETRDTIGTAQITAIARKTGASDRTVRDTLSKAGKYTPRARNRG